MIEDFLNPLLEKRFEEQLDSGGVEYRMTVTNPEAPPRLMNLEVTAVLRRGSFSAQIDVPEVSQLDELEKYEQEYIKGVLEELMKKVAASVKGTNLEVKDLPPKST